MKLIVTLLLIVACDDAAIIEPDALAGTVCYNVPGTACEAVNEIAKAYCDREALCWGTTEPNCEEFVIRTICEENDCSKYYSAANHQTLDTCIEMYNAAPCDGPKPSTCKLY